MLLLNHGANLIEFHHLCGELSQNCRVNLKSGDILESGKLEGGKTFVGEPSEIILQTIKPGELLKGLVHN